MRWVLLSCNRVVLVTFGLLLLLDGAQSVYARIGYADPVEAWGGRTTPNTLTLPTPTG